MREVRVYPVRFGPYLSCGVPETPSADWCAGVWLQFPARQEGFKIPTPRFSRCQCHMSTIKQAWPPMTLYATCTMPAHARLKVEQSRF